MIRIGEFSSLAKTTIKTLRFYDEIGLFKPCLVDYNGYRYYNIEQLNDLQKIVELRNLDVPIDKIKQMLNGHNIVEILNERMIEIENELVKDKLNLSLIKKYVAKAQKGEFMNTYKPKKVIIPKCIVFYRHGIIDSMSDISQFVLQAGEEVIKNNPNLKCAKPDYCYVTYSANEYKEKNVELEYAQAVESFGKESENIKFKEVPQVTAMSILHKGSYATMQKAYAFAINYVNSKGYVISGPIRERYIDGCWNQESEDNYLTEIQIPIK